MTRKGFSLDRAEDFNRSISSEEESCLASDDLDLLNLRVAGDRGRKNYSRFDDEELDEDSRPRGRWKLLLEETRARLDRREPKLLSRVDRAAEDISIRGSSSLRCVSTKSNPQHRELTGRSKFRRGQTRSHGRENPAAPTAHSPRQVTFAEANYSSGEGPSVRRTDVKLRYRRRGTPRIVRALRRHSRKHVPGDAGDNSPGPREENSKSSVVVLYRGNLTDPSSRVDLSLLPRTEDPTTFDEGKATKEVEESSRKGAPVAGAKSISDKRNPKESADILGSLSSDSGRGLAEEDEGKSADERNFTEARSFAERLGSRSTTLGNLEGIALCGKFRRGRRAAKRQRCRPFDDRSRAPTQMADRIGFGGEGSLESRSFLGGAPNLSYLMQRVRCHSPKGTGDGKELIVTSSEEARRIFPFRATPSGNLKIVPNQVVFESKKVSVLVADPRHTRIDVKADLGRPILDAGRSPVVGGARQDATPRGISRSTPDQSQRQRSCRTAEEDRRPRTRPFRSQARQGDMEQRQAGQGAGANAAASSLTSRDTPLSALGFNGDQPIDWDNVVLPEKTDLYQELARRITNYKNADCIIRLGHDEFHCHLLVLQSYSTFFDEKNYKDVDLTGSSVTSRAFSIIYDWMISPTCESCHLLRRDNILEIFTASQYLGVKELEEQCWAFIDNDELFSEDTAFLLYLESRKIGNTAVMELMVPRIMKFFLMLVSTKDFLELAVEEVCSLLRSNYICVNSEMEVLMSAVRWLMHDWEGRRQYLLEVMKCVRFGLIAPWQLVDVKRNPENPEFMELVSYPEVQKMVDDGLAFVIIKYWYGNQTEDYYHWIDLLGLAEPTNRNWAGEDKNYVTYREFLAYLEEYQRTRMPELKAPRKPKTKPAIPDSSSKEFADRPPSPISRTRACDYPPASYPVADGCVPGDPPIVVIGPGNNNNNNNNNNNTNNGNNAAAASPGGGGGGQRNSASKYATSNVQLPKMPVPPYLPPGTPASMMVPPEMLNDYLTSLDRNSKGEYRIVGHRDENEENHAAGRGNRVGDAGDHLPTFGDSKSIKGRATGKKNRVERTKKQDDRIFRYRLPEPNITRRRGENYEEDRGESSRSEEEAATVIQAVYRGYKARRRLNEVRESSSEVRRTAKRVTELLTMPPLAKNLREPLEPVKMSSGNFRGRDNVDRETGGRASLVPRTKKRETQVAPRDVGQERSSFEKDLEGLRFDVGSPRVSPRHVGVPGATDLPAASTSGCSTTVPKAIRTIKSPSFFHRCAGRAGSATPSENDDTDDPFSPRIVDERTTMDPTTRSSTVSDAAMPGSTIADFHASSPSNRLAPRRFSASLLPSRPSKVVYEKSSSLFYPEREAVLIFGGIDPDEDYGCEGNTGRDIYRFEPTENVWEFVGEIPEPRRHHSVAYLNGRVYLAGGADPRKDDVQRTSAVVNTVWSYDPTTRGWHTETGMLTPRKNFSLVVSDGKMFALGGQDRNGAALGSVEAFDPADRSWRHASPMYVARIGPASATYQNRIWVAGGLTKSKDEPLTREVECYEPSANSWSRVTALRAPRCFATMRVVSDRLYLIGGAGNVANGETTSKSLDSIDVWDQDARAWRCKACMTIARHGHSTGSIGGQLLIVGGLTTVWTGTLKSVECYCCERECWIKGISSLPYAISGHGCVSLPPANLSMKFE